MFAEGASGDWTLFERRTIMRRAGCRERGMTKKGTSQVHKQ
jgi:hypothetical protein